MSFRARVESGVSSDGLQTAVLPAARAGASFQTSSSSGKFQGTMQPTTPCGSLTTTANWLDSIGGITRPVSERPTSA